MEKLISGLKNFFSGLKSFLLGILLLIVAIALLIILTPWGIIEAIYAIFWKKKFYEGLEVFGDMILVMAVVVDIMGNVILQFPLNRILNTKEGYKFGSRFDTISYVLGHGQVHGTLTETGLKLCNILDKFDPDHCVGTYYSRNKQDDRKN